MIDLNAVLAFVVFFYFISDEIEAQLVLKYRIIGGEETSIELHPYAVSITYHENYACGGAVINSRHVLTAAHCFYRNIQQNPKSIQRYFHIRAGITEVETEPKIATSMSLQSMLDAEEKKVLRNIYTIEFARLHPNFSISNYSNDICVLRTVQPFMFNELIQPIALPEPDFKIPTGATVQVSGWGMTEYGGSRSKHLQTVNVTVFDWADCAGIYSPTGRAISQDMFCAGDKTVRRDACSGDSGGALTYTPTSADGQTSQRIILGIVSWGFKCGDLTFPGVYTNVAMFANWIKEVINS